MAFSPLFIIVSGVFLVHFFLFMENCYYHGFCITKNSITLIVNAVSRWFWFGVTFKILQRYKEFTT
jgi:hypothetical protein